MVRSITPVSLSMLQGPHTVLIHKIVTKFENNDDISLHGEEHGEYYCMEKNSGHFLNVKFILVHCSKYFKAKAIKNIVKSSQCL